jgi:hypothetical protein
LRQRVVFFQAFVKVRFVPDGGSACQRWPQA